MTAAMSCSGTKRTSAMRFAMSAPRMQSGHRAKELVMSASDILRRYRRALITLHVRMKIADPVRRYCYAWPR
jgi:hypothetical protein